MLNVKGVPQFEYCAIKKTKNGSDVSLTEFRSSTCDSKLESTWPRLHLDADTANMRRPLANLKYPDTYCASAVHIHLESPNFAISLPPLSSTLQYAALLTSSNTNNNRRTTICNSTNSTSQLSYIATTITSNGSRSFSLLDWVALNALIIMLVSAVIAILIFLVLFVIRRKRARDTKGMWQLLHCTVGSVFCMWERFQILLLVLVFSQALMYLHLFL